MFLLAGLGNPGPKYAGNRHNVGFMALDAICRRHRLAPLRRRFQSLAAEGEIAGEKVIALFPETYMNESGRAVSEAMRFYKIPLDRVFVLHDELDLPPAKVRLKKGGGNAGHNGLRSITAQCGNDYWRVRLGIGHPGDKQMVMPYVLGDFAKSEKGWVDAVCDACADFTDLLAAGRPEEFQNRAHLFLEAQGFSEPKRVGEKG
ncbi:aminoacyl-tRNA hydrolase [Xanthobacter tagetidis]|uniref:Peptidyl-tRNA hydrolase n=1 Tax=Xanthobacter tagetidis TaxID=60216 RepID=A0A3L7AED0_9HYPH|nr:aminoacyl-tRNA hydrolase [Xanthobacter tagetidis]MBB6308454.1 PTH1 family peptidyl-tRNA hydrolase [Xanthobacter tagetidis]RLP78763.1 aminoacyl-tRNA hydrolase [Xanthobacter tagetidis]